MSLSGTLARSTSVADAAEAIGVAALALTSGQRGAVYLQAPDGTAARLWASRSDFPEDRGAFGSGPAIFTDVRDLPTDDEIRRTAEREGYRALASWPLTRGGETLGSMVCCFDAPRIWSAAELDVMAALAMQGAAALESALLAERAGGAEPAAGADDVRIAEALRILQTESTSLSEAHRELEAQHARLTRARRELGALNVWLLAVHNELHTERARLAAEHTRLVKARDELASEDARVAAARDALDAQIAAARQELDKESARLAQMRQDLFENHTRQAEARRDPPAAAVKSKPPDRTRVSDARRILEEESARLMESLEIADAPADAPAVPQPARPAEPSAVPAAAASSGRPEAFATNALDPGDTTPAPPAFELGGPLAVRTFEDLYPLLVERAATLLNQGRSLKADDQVKVLGRALDDRDGHRAGYSERLEAWAEATAGMLGCGRAEIGDVRRAALLHDLGKIGVPGAILRAAARLTDQEKQIVRSVPSLAEQVLRPVKGMEGVAAILGHRYEQWDGKGYPGGLKGDQIPLGARILAVVDAYGVMTTVRPYRAMVYSLDAVAELRRCAGAQFDPKVVEAFCNVLKREG
ncbi:MAG: HD domain-containing phosphohydrolase [bacterium]